MQNTQSGSKIKYAKNMRKTFLQTLSSRSMQKTAPKTANIRKIRPV